MDSDKAKALKETEGIYIDFKNLTEEQKLRFQGVYLTMLLLKDNNQNKQSA